MFTVDRNRHLNRHKKSTTLERKIRDGIFDAILCIWSEKCCSFEESLWEKIAMHENFFKLRNKLSSL